MKKIALIGSNGQLGTDILKIFGKRQNIFLIIPLTHQEIEITIQNSIKKILDEINPDIVISTAAYHRVDEMENNPEKAFLVNSVGSKNLAKYCSENNQKLVFISTDYVFGIDTKRKKPYKETDLPGPINVYGNSKLAGEYFVLSSSEKNIVIRSSWLFGSAGSSGKGGNFVETMLKRAHESGKIAVVEDQISSPTYTYNLAEQLLLILENDIHGLFHASSEGSCSWFEFANTIFSLTNTHVICTPTNEKKFPTPAKRPHYSVLENKRLKNLGLNMLRGWKENLLLYLKEQNYLS